MKFSYLGTALGSNAPSATLFVNSSQAAAGKVGIALSLPPGNTFAAGSREIANIRFTPTATGVGTNTVSFTNQPVAQVASNPNADEVGVGFVSGTWHGHGGGPANFGHYAIHHQRIALLAGFGCELQSPVFN
jgi:hypothetical protein